MSLDTLYYSIEPVEHARTGSCMGASQRLCDTDCTTLSTCCYMPDVAPWGRANVGAIVDDNICVTFFLHLFPFGLKAAVRRAETCQQ